MVDAYIRLILDAGNEEKARAVLGRFNDFVEAVVLDLKPHRDGGFEASVKLPVVAETWPEQVVFAIRSAQAFGYGWALSGNVAEAIDMTTREFKIPGLRFAWLTLERSH